MTKELTLIIPHYGRMNAPANIPSGGGITALMKGGSGLLMIAFVLAALIALFFLIWGGIQWIMSEGDKTKVQAARLRITYAIGGLALLLFSLFIVNMVGYIFNVTI